MSEKDDEREYLVGVSSGLERAAHHLMEKAVLYFRSRKDSEAELLRSFAVDFKKQADEIHPGPPK